MKRGVFKRNLQQSFDFPSNSLEFVLNWLSMLVFVYLIARKYWSARKFKRVSSLTLPAADISRHLQAVAEAASSNDFGPRFVPVFYTLCGHCHHPSGAKWIHHCVLELPMKKKCVVTIVLNFFQGKNWTFLGL